MMKKITFRIRRTIEDSWKVIPISAMDEYAYYRHFATYQQAVNYVFNINGKLER